MQVVQYKKMAAASLVWEPLEGKACSARESASSTLVCTQKHGWIVIVIGGYDSKWLNDISVFSVSNSRWLVTEQDFSVVRSKIVEDGEEVFLPSPSKRSGHSASLIPQQVWRDSFWKDCEEPFGFEGNRIIVHGGFDGERGEYYRDCWLLHIQPFEQDNSP